MAEAAVSLALEWIGSWLIGKATILKEVRRQVDDLRKELRDIRRFLKSADAKQHEDDQIRDWVAEIREAAYDAEDVISTFVLEVESRKGRGVKRAISKSLDVGNEVSARSKIASQIDSIKSDIARLKGSLVSFGLTAPTERGCSSFAVPERRTFHFDFEPDFVGFKADIKILVAKLVSEDKHCKVISICGMGGLGKTTLAQRLYREQEVKDHFEAFAWVSISQQWNRKDLLQRILIGLLPEKSNEIVSMIEDQLVELLNTFMLEKTCLVVLDDIWSERAWDDLSPAFPRANSSSKILLTSRKKSVARYADRLGYMHDLECLTKEEGLELLLKKAILPTAESTNFEIDPNKKKLGSEMVEQCGCLPLAIVVLGGLLATKHSLTEWQDVHRNVGSYLEGRRDYVGECRRMSKVLDLSYRELPYELKACFLYLASFLENFDIEAERLYCLWMAEGFVSQKDDSHTTTMEIAEQKLVELAQRCMVQVKFKSEEKSVNKGGRRFESLRLHNLMRDFCLLKANEENFLTVINFELKDEQVKHLFSNSSSTGASNGSSPKIHRLAIHLPDNDSVSKLQLLKQAEKLRDVRTLLFICKEPVRDDQLAMFSKGLRLLRVLDFITNGKWWFATELPKEIGDLILLRYLSLRGTGFEEKLPSSIGNLRYLQTLDLRECHMAVPNVLWKMEGLIHLYLPYYSEFLLDSCMLRVDKLSNLETLENFSPDMVDVEGLFNLTNLRRLNRICIWERLDLLKEVNNFLLDSGHPQVQEASIEIVECDFRSEEELSILRQLLSSDCLVELKIEGTINRLPGYDPQLYQSLANLTLTASKLEEDPMATLEKLPNLRRLYLLNRAFVGKKMVCSSHGFPNLRYLRLDYLPNLEEWRVDNAMPNLSTLVIDCCEKLKMLPEGLRFISTLRELEIKNMSNEFEERLHIEV